MSGRKSALAALQQLRESKSGKKRSDQYELPVQETVYEEMDPEAYERQVKENRAAGTWIEGDEGYQDHGELEHPADDIPDDEKPGKTKRKKKSKQDKSARQKKKEEATVFPSKRIENLFLASNDAASEPSAKKARILSQMDLDRERKMDEMMLEMMEDPFELANEDEDVPQAKVSAEAPSTKKRKSSQRSSKTSLPSQASPSPSKKRKIEDEDEDDSPVSLPITEEADSAPTSAVIKPDPVKEETSTTPVSPRRSPRKHSSSTLAPPKPVVSASKSISPTVQVKRSNENDSAVDSAALGSTWNDVTKESVSLVLETSTSTPVKSGSSSLPLTNDGSMQFFWIDAQEESARPGHVFLFGKIQVDNDFASCTAIVKDVFRTLYVAPRAVASKNFEDIIEKDSPVNIKKHVIPELLRIFKRHGIQPRIKEVERNYAFDVPGVTQGVSKWVKVLYPYSQPDLQDDELSGATFAHIFGAKVGPVENLIIQRRVMGPCWLTLANPTGSWTAYEVSVDSLTSVSVSTFENRPKSIPTLRVLSLKVQTVMNTQVHKNEIVAVGVALHREVRIDGPTTKPDAVANIVFLRKLQGLAVPLDFLTSAKKELVTVQLEASEAALLGVLMAHMHKIDPDVIVGHNFVGFDLDVLLHRMRDNSVPYWSKLGRLSRSKMPTLQAGAGGQGESTFQEKIVLSGRLLCDTYVCAKEFLKSKNYNGQLGLRKVEIDPEQVPSMFTTSTPLIELCKSTISDAVIAMRLMFKMNVLPLTKMLTDLCGNRWNRSLMSMRAERIEYLLMHEFYAQKPKYVLPDRAQTKFNKKKEKAKYGGGLVLEPKVGFYDSFVLLLDFNSLYPSLIQEYNVCFTTIPRQLTASGEWEEVSPPPPHIERGILPKVIRKFVQQRRAVKGEIKQVKDPIRLQQLDIQQLALKLVANSMYGCLGFSNSRFFALPLAQLITQKGREALKMTAETATSSLGIEVIYGDTDSIFMNTKTNDLQKVKEIGQMVKKKVNAVYKELEIEIDGIFASLLLLKKKKYAALLVQETPGKDKGYTTQRQTKGIDMVRRDWSVLSAEMSSVVLDCILAEQKSREDVVNEIHSYLRSMAEQVRNRKIPIEKFAITKAISKNPEEYPDKNLPHVAVALAEKKRGKSVAPGDFIQYVICKIDDNSSSKSLSERAMSLDEARKKNLNVDVEWYMANQIHPPIARLCSPIDGTDSSIIADCLGLDGSKFAVHTHTRNEDSSSVMFISVRTSDGEKYRSAEKLKFTCPKCHIEQPEFEGVYSYTKEHHFFQGLSCTRCSTEFSSGFIRNQISLAARRLIRKYYEFQMACGKCGLQTNQVCLVKDNNVKCTRSDCRGSLYFKYDTTALYTQLCYFRDLFDIKRAIELSNNEEDQKEILAVTLENTYKRESEIFNACQLHARSLVLQNSFGRIQLGPLLSVFSER